MFKHNQRVIHYIYGVGKVKRINKKQFRSYYVSFLDGSAQWCNEKELEELR